MKRRTFIASFTGAIAAGLLMAGVTCAATVTLSWRDSANDPATTNILGYRIYYDTVSHASVTDPVDMTTASPYTTMIQVADPNARTYDLGTFAPGTYYFRMTAYGTLNGSPADSAFSEEISGQVGILTPVNLMFTITYP